MDNDQCALAPDGSLLDESLIQFIYDPDDPRPMPTLGTFFSSDLLSMLTFSQDVVNARRKRLASRNLFSLKSKMTMETPLHPANVALPPPRLPIATPDKSLMSMSPTMMMVTSRTPEMTMTIMILRRSLTLMPSPSTSQRL